MKFSVSFLAAALLLCLTSAAPAPAASRRVIIKYKPDVQQSKFNSFLEGFKQRSTSLASANKVKYAYDPKLFNGFAGQFSTDFLDALQKEHAGQIEYIVDDGVVHTLGSQSSPPSWGLSRISEQNLDLAQPYDYPDSAGAGVDVWVVDTGVMDSHTDFGGRAKMVKSFVANEEATDLNGHGTHCSGTIASATYGVAKNVKLFGVKVMDASGSGTDSDVVAGIQYVAQNVRKGKTVLSMSLGGDKTQSIDDAINAAVAAGVVAIVAAGNDSADACQGSPSGASGVLAVGATDNTDALASFSDTGSCVGILAPGVDITSLWIGSDDATNTISGTSMATPHVAGVAALYMAQNDYATPQDVYADLKAKATQGVITGLDDTTTNALLFNNVSSDSSDGGDGGDGSNLKSLKQTKGAKRTTKA